MSDQAKDSASPAARVIEIDAADDPAPRLPLAPQIIPTERCERITPS